MLYHAQCKHCQTVMEDSFANCDHICDNCRRKEALKFLVEIIELVTLCKEKIEKGSVSHRDLSELNEMNNDLDDWYNSLL